MKKTLVAASLGLLTVGLALPVFAVRSPEQQEAYEEQQQNMSDLHAQQTQTARQRSSSNSQSTGNSSTTSNGASEAEVRQLRSEIAALTTRVANLERELNRVEGSSSKRSK